jgi:branched-chain amino acid transport system substrate-binding protein
MKYRKLFALAAFTVGWLASSASAEEPIRIGAVLSVTGAIGYAGDPALKTMELYIHDINAAGGVLGRKLQLISYDDASEAAKANAFAKRLIANDKVDILIGGSGSGASMSIIPLVESAGVPFISLAGSVTIIDPVKKWVFKTPHTDRMAAEKVFEDMRKRGIKRVALLSETSGFGQSGRKETVGVAGKFDITLVADETFGPKDTDMTAQLTKIKGIPDLQAVFIFGAGPGPAIATKNFAQLGIQVPLYQSHGVGTDEYLRLAGAAAEGVRLPSPALLVASQLPDADPQKGVIQDLQHRYQAKYKQDVSPFSGYAYDALHIAVDAIKRAGGTEKAKVRDAIEQTKGFVGQSGTFTMSPTDHMGLNTSAFRLLEAKQGKWTVVP